MPWVGGRVPLSEPECGFDGNKCQIQSCRFSVKSYTELFPMTPSQLLLQIGW